MFLLAEGGVDAVLHLEGGRLGSHSVFSAGFLLFYSGASMNRTWVRSDPGGKGGPAGADRVNIRLFRLPCVGEGVEGKESEIPITPESAKRVQRCDPRGLRVVGYAPVKQGVALDHAPVKQGMVVGRAPVKQGAVVSLSVGEGSGTLGTLGGNGTPASRSQWLVPRVTEWRRFSWPLLSPSAPVYDPDCGCATVAAFLCLWGGIQVLRKTVSLIFRLKAWVLSKLFWAATLVRHVFLAVWSGLGAAGRALENNPMGISRVGGKARGFPCIPTGSDVSEGEPVVVEAFVPMKLKYFLENHADWSDPEVRAIIRASLSSVGVSDRTYTEIDMSPSFPVSTPASLESTSSSLGREITEPEFPEETILWEGLSPLMPSSNGDKGEIACESGESGRTGVSTDGENACDLLFTPAGCWVMAKGQGAPPPDLQVGASAGFPGQAGVGSTPHSPQGVAVGRGMGEVDNPKTPKTRGWLGGRQYPPPGSESCDPANTQPRRRPSEPGEECRRRGPEAPRATLRFGPSR